MVVWPKLQQFLANLNFIFLLHNFSRYVIYENFFIFFSYKVLGDMARTRVALHTDIRTDIHGGKNNICLPQGETYNESNNEKDVSAKTDPICNA